MARQKPKKPTKKVEGTKHTSSASPTQVEYGTFQRAYDHFNIEVFDGRLPDHCLIVLSRKANSMGHFAADRFSSRNGDGRLNELSLNPDHFHGKSDEEICSTLVHEMVHGWQHLFGKPSWRGYHNKEWAAAMKAIGLHPSSTGGVGGKEVGQSVSHYIVRGGPFQQAYAKLAKTGFKLNWESAERSTQSKPPKNSKTHFTCELCGQNAWGKPDLAILCKPCRHEMGAADRTQQVAA